LEGKRIGSGEELRGGLSGRTMGKLLSHITRKGDQNRKKFLRKSFQIVWGGRGKKTTNRSRSSIRTGKGRRARGDSWGEERKREQKGRVYEKEIGSHKGTV